MTYYRNFGVCHFNNKTDVINPVIDIAKLHYFPGRERAETTRWMLANNQTAFENVLIDSPEALAALRATEKLPFDQMPLLEIDGKNLSQSHLENKLERTQITTINNV
jgi:hypothetical protein